MPDRSSLLPPRRRAAALLAAGAALTLAGCGGSSSGTGPTPSASPATGSSTAQLQPAPEPASAAPAVAPAGKLVKLGSAVEGVVADPSTNTVAAAIRGDRLALLDATTGALRTTVPVGGTARHLQLAKPGGPVLVPGEDTDTLVQVALPAGTVTAKTKVGRQPHDAAYDPASGRIVVADELGGSVSFIENGTSIAQLPGPVQPGGVAVAAGRAGVVDVRGNIVYVYDVASARQIAALPAGAGVTHAVPLGDGRIVVSDTRGNALDVFALDGTPRLLSRIPFQSSPYGMAVDESRSRLYVAASGANQLVRFDIGSGGTLTRRGAAIATAQQPNSLAVDSRTGTVFVGSSVPDGGVEMLEQGS